MICVAGGGGIIIIIIISVNSIIVRGRAVLVCVLYCAPLAAYCHLSTPTLVTSITTTTATSYSLLHDPYNSRDSNDNFSASNSSSTK